MNRYDRFGRSALRAALSAVFLAGAGPRARAAFDAPAISAQAAAMGGAGLAARGDSASLFLNPAGVAGLRRPEAYLLYNRLYAGLSGVDGIGQSFASAGFPMGSGALAVGFWDLRAAGLLEERVIGVAFARRWFDAFEAGVTAKYMHHRYEIGSDPAAAADPVFREGTSRGAFSFDLGASAALSGSLTAGLAARNVNRPDMGLESADRLPREIQAGLSWSVDRWNLRLTADYLHRGVDSGSWRERGVPGLGLEKSFDGGRVKFRLGVTPDQLSGGGGLQFDRLGFDYAFILSRRLLADNAGTHRIGVRYRFGGAAAPPPAP